jgi:hypothetical protein
LAKQIGLAVNRFPTSGKKSRIGASRVWRTKNRAENKIRSESIHDGRRTSRHHASSLTGKRVLYFGPSTLDAPHALNTLGGEADPRTKRFTSSPLQMAEQAVLDTMQPRPSIGHSSSEVCYTARSPQQPRSSIALPYDACAFLLPSPAASSTGLSKLDASHGRLIGSCVSPQLTH